MSKDDSLSPGAWHSHQLLTAGSNSSNLPFWMLHAGLELRLLAAPHANDLLPSDSLWRQLRVASCKLCSATPRELSTLFCCAQ